MFGIEYIKIFRVQDRGVIPAVDMFLQENDRFLPNDPYELLKNGSYLQIPLLVGTADYVTEFC